MILREVNRVGEGKKNVPKLRFKGYEDAWEQRSFKEITFLSGKKNKDNLPLESYSITNEDGFVPQNEHFENGGTMKEADKSMYIIVSANSFAYNPARINVGSIGYKTDGEDVIVSSLYEVFKTIDDIDDNFLWHWFKSPHLQRLIMKFQEGGVRLYFYYNKLCLGYISVPEYREQNRISQMLETLDSLITLHQRKYDALKTMKKTLLSKMFPKDGEDVPEIRFKGFTDAWEQRKLGNVAKYRNGKAHEQSVSENGKYVIVNSKFVSTNGEVQKFSCEQIEPLFKNEIAFVLSDVPNGRAIARTFLIPHDDKYTLNQRIAGITPNETTDCYFLHLLMNRNHYFLRFDDGVKQTNLSVNDVMGFSTYYPLYKEQQLCGQFFKKIDNLITLHQRKLEELKNMKKTLLQQMFV